MHTNSKLLFQKYARVYFHPRSRVLEIGPDRFPSPSYRSIVNGDGPQNETETWDTIDIYRDSRFTYAANSEYSFPIPDNAYDIVLSGNVMEHVRKPWVWIREVARVCKVGGTVITIVPVSWPHPPAPLDCWRAYPDGLAALYEDAGLEVLLAVWESLELPGYRRYTPGMSPEFHGRRRERLQRLLGPLGFPVERAYDSIAVGRKRPHPVPWTAERTADASIRGI